MPIKPLTIGRNAARSWRASVVGLGLAAALLLLSALWLQGCASLSPQCIAFYNLDVKERKERFKTYTIEKQYDLYMCEMEREPPDLEYVDFIARGGQKNVPFLLEKLKASRSDIERRDILSIFRSMSVTGNLQCTQEVLNQLDQAVSGMFMELYKDDARESLDQVKKISCHAAS